MSAAAATAAAASTTMKCPNCGGTSIEHAGEGKACSCSDETRDIRTRKRAASGDDDKKNDGTSLKRARSETTAMAAKKSKHQIRTGQLLNKFKNACTLQTLRAGGRVIVIQFLAEQKGILPTLTCVEGSALTDEERVLLLGAADLYTGEDQYSWDVFDALLKTHGKVLEDDDPNPPHLGPCPHGVVFVSYFVGAFSIGPAMMKA